MKRLLFFSLLILTFSLVKAQIYDSIRVSLLTVAPHSRAVFTIFGHTALRVYDPIRDIDVVFNWGTFDQSKPNFMLRFMQGKTDYFLRDQFYLNFIPEYVFDKTTIFEQVLNIPDSEKEPLLLFLQKNCLPENIEYRYNFVFDNCTTRPRDIIEQFCGGNLIYPEQTQPITFRQLFHQYTKPYPWTELGIDCIIGSGADSLVSFREELFLPDKFMYALDRSIVKSVEGEEQPIVLASKTILQSPDSQRQKSGFWCQPFNIGFIIFFIYLALVIIAYMKKMKFRLPFVLLFLIAGIGGCIVAMLSFFSVHPCVQHNWNIIWLHPLHFIAVLGFFFNKSYLLIRWYHALNFVLLSGFLLGWYWIPQQLNKAFTPFILCLLVVSGLQFIVLKRKKV